MEVNQNKKIRKFVFWEAVKLKLNSEIEACLLMSEYPTGKSEVNPWLFYWIKLRWVFVGSIQGGIFDCTPEVAGKECLWSNLKKIIKIGISSCFLTVNKMSAVMLNNF